MSFSPPTLHPNVIATDEQRDLARSRIEALVSRRPESGGKRVDDGMPIAIRLTTVSTDGGFDSYIQLRCPLPRALRVVQPDLLVDSGNATLIVPYGEQLTEANGYQLLGTTTEPWGAPAKVVQGPIQIPTTDGTFYEIANCVFYACTGNNMYGTRTANFGLGCLSPWSSQRGNVPLPGKPPLQAPLSYNASYPCVEVVFAPARTMFADDGSLTLTDGSLMMLYPSQPKGFTTMAITPNLGWMSVIPTSLAIGGQATQWPGPPAFYICAVIDTGGTSAYLGDPNNLVWDKTWPESVTCPAWAGGSVPAPSCTAARLDIGLAQSGGSPSYAYTIDTHLLPASVQGLTLVMYQNGGQYMPYGNDSINTGGITALFNRILIDYANAQVGFAPNSPYWTEVIELDQGTVQKSAAISPPTVPGILIGYDYFTMGSVVTTTMTISWEDLPPGAVLHVQHGGSPGAEVVNWSGPNRGVGASGQIEATCGIFRQTGAAVPILIYAWRSGYVPVKVKVKATTN
ncbi:MAG: hypothetical protein EPO55_16990 [Reyranella sp.]|uniref:hypothetical protein n=1 Tax=Reyranella sp. TaxID=1929291 RepID=UPI0011F97641|nr:hypothetical protein [Reyranella sp.]TAJ38028.1 MAG: hypothetical protein EPO55_16990 [Reyranella sp.]